MKIQTEQKKYYKERHRQAEKYYTLKEKENTTWREVNKEKKYHRQTE